MFRQQKINNDNKMIIDIHTHIGKDVSDPKLEKYSKDQLLADMDKNQIQHSAVFPFNRPDEDLLKESLRILELSKENKKIIPFLRFNPNTITKEELNKLLSNGFKGVKLHPRAQNFVFNKIEYDWIYKIIEKHNIPLLIHTRAATMDTSDPAYAIDIAQRFPHLKIIAAHFFGGGLNNDLLNQVAKHKNLYVDTSVYSSIVEMRRVVKTYDRLIYGSDAPYSDQEVEILKIKKAKLPKKIEDKILFKNALEVLNLK